MLHAGRTARVVVCGIAIKSSCNEPAFLQVDHAYDHGTTWIEWKVVKAPASIELAYFIIKGMRKNAEASDLARRPQRGRQRKLKQ
jgi:expansin (peptidoglycan-binding protein)